MPEQELDNVKGDTTVPQEGRHAVAVTVRMDALVDAGLARDRSDNLLNPAGTEGLGPVRLEKVPARSPIKVEAKLLAEIPP
jgi:hypothetical protein